MTGPLVVHMLLLALSSWQEAQAFVTLRQDADSGRPRSSVGPKMEYEHGTSQLRLADRPTCHVRSYEADKDIDEMRLSAIYYLSSP